MNNENENMIVLYSVPTSKEYEIFDMEEVEQVETIAKEEVMGVENTLRIAQIVLPILFIIVTAIIIVYDIKSKASTTKKTIISITGIAIIPVIWIIITIIQVSLSINTLM